MRSGTLLLLSVTVLFGGADGKKESKEEHRGMEVINPSHRDSKLKQDRTNVEESSPDGTLDSLEAELQGYLNREKGDDEKLGKDEMEMMENDGDDNADMMKEDDAEVMNNRDEIDGIKEMVDDGNAGIEEMWEQEEPSDDDESELVHLNEQSPSSIDANHKGHVGIQWRRRRWSWRWRRCRCNRWKNSYNRERNTKNYYYRLYVAYNRHYRNYYRKYHAYYRYYRRCYHRNRTCKSKYYRLRYGYKYLLKSYSHLYHTCKNRG